MRIKHISSVVLVAILLMLSLLSFAETINYSYDSLNRIVREERSSGAVIVYAYDSAGNRTSKVVSGSPVTSTTTTSIIDTDGDGIPDSQDNCPNKPNGPTLGTCSSTSDKPGGNCTTDADCVIGCSVNGQCLKNQEDADNDGRGDVCDNCPANCNSQQLDADTDGIGDVCDTTPGCGGCSGVACETQC